MSAFLHHGRAGGVLTVTMNQPETRNALTGNTAVQEFVELADSVARDTSVRVVVLTGADPVFSSGGNVKDMKRFFDDALKPATIREEYRHGIQRLALAVYNLDVPTIAAVNGPAIGAGFIMMLCCDIMIASDNAHFVMPEINVGLAGGARYLMDFFSRSKVRSIYFTGRRVPAAELYRLGVLEACPPRDKLMDAAMDLAREIASKSPIAVQKIKRAMNAIENMPVRDGYRYEQGVTIDLSHTEDAREAQRAFVEKRKPVFKGR